MAQTTVQTGPAFSNSSMLRKTLALLAAVALGIGIGLMVSRGPAEVPAIDSAGSGVPAAVVGSLSDDFATRHLAAYSGQDARTGDFDGWKDDYATRHYRLRG